MSEKAMDSPCCQEWEPQTEIIDGYIGFVSLRSNTDTFTSQGGIAFRFCPWCGRHRETFEREKPSTDSVPKGG